MTISPFILMPLFGAVLGYATNWLAIKMLFRPLTAKRLFGVRLPFTPGLMPKERVRLSKAVAKAVGDHLFTPEAIRTAIAAPATLSHVESLVDALCHDLLDNDAEPSANCGPTGDNANDLLCRFADRLGQMLDNNPVLTAQLKNLLNKAIENNVGKFAALFINRDKAFESIKAGIIEMAKDADGQRALWGHIKASLTDDDKRRAKETVHALVAAALKKGADQLVEMIDVTSFVEARINSFDMLEGERIVLSVMGRELRVIMALGGVIGFFVGFLMAFISPLG